MSTNDFVKETGRDKLWEVMAEELRELQDESGFLKKELAKHVDCVLCGIDETDPVFVKEGFHFVKCKKCGLVYVNPQVDTEKAYSWYRKLKSHDIWVDMVLTNDQQKEFDTKKFEGFCADLERLIGKKGRVLDVGCSSGHFLDIARKRGWDVAGLELNDKAVKHARDVLGLDVRPQLLNESDFEPESFDVISLWEVLEHVPDPRLVLNDCRKFLKPGGILAILVPNRNALSAMILQEYCSCFGGRNHLWYFSIDALSKLLIQIGFHPIESETKTILSQVNEITGYMSYRNPYLSKPDEHDFKFQDDIKEKLEKFIFENNLGYKLLMYSAKD
ncbi:MAG: class I SAM-dependent methyltransferase [bacterium]